MITWSTFHRTLTLSIGAAVVAATVLAGAAADPQPRNTPVSTEGKESSLAETAVPLTTGKAPKSSRHKSGASPAPNTANGQGGGDVDDPIAELKRSTTKPFSMVGVTWASGGEQFDVSLSYRRDGTWSAFEKLDVDPGPGDAGGRSGTEPLWVGEGKNGKGADGVAVRIASTTGQLPRDVKVATIDPGENAATSPTAAQPGKPRIVSRKSWGAKPVSARACSAPRYGSTRGATIHHSAGSNSYSRSQAPGIVRSYQSYHQSRGWCDIGYNFVVDRFGRIYEGRRGGTGQMVRGAHAGANDANRNTIGVAMMGTFNSAQPAKPTRKAVANLVAWRFGKAKIPAKGTHRLDGKRVQRISGHRDVRSTECPGRRGYSWVTRKGGLRDSVAKRLSARSYRWSAPSGLEATLSTPRSIRYQWNRVAGAKKYVLQVSRKSSMSQPRSFAFSSNRGWARLRPPKGNYPYYARVQVRHSKTNRALSPWSKVVRARTSASSSSGKVDASGATNKARDQRRIGNARSVRVKGRGYGHGIGMSQWGAYGAAADGVRASKILNRYYPGTKRVSRSAYLRVHLTADDDGSTAVRARRGIRLVQGSRDVVLPTTISGRRVNNWRVEPYSVNRTKSVLRYKAGSKWYTYRAMTWHGSADFASKRPLKLALPGGKTATYRGKLRAARPASGSKVRRTVNVVKLDTYTRGVIAREVPASWPSEALRSQAIAARTYGLRAKGSATWYDICDTRSCQVYGGVAAETRRTDSAVASTAKRVLYYRGKPAFTQFSASSGGYTNKGSQPYLRAVRDPWDNNRKNANRSWSTSVRVSSIEKRFRSIGKLRSIQVTKRNGKGAAGGRVLQVRLVGSKKSVRISGVDARWAFGLKSDWFSF